MKSIRKKTRKTDPAVSARLENEHVRSEILVSWLQLCFVGAFLAVYFLAPKGFLINPNFESVPLIFTFYGPFVILRIVLAHFRKLGHIFLTLSVIVDTLVIGALIWSWHKQYMQPAPFYLKVPTFTAFYLMIALRALSFKVQYLVMTGVFSVLVWTALVLYTLILAPELRTNDFAEYIMGNKILVGAEVEKILSLFAVTTILSIAAVRSSRLLHSSVEEALANKSMSRFFSPSVMAKIKESGDTIRPGYGELRSAAILTMDLRGFTKLSATMRPEQVMTLLAEYQARIVPIIFAHGGSIDKFMGDGVLAHFGAATVSSTYAADCLRATQALDNDINKWNDERKASGKIPMKIGIGCAIGDVIFGAVGDQDRLEITTIGDAVNFAAKLEKHTKELGVSAIVTETMYYESLKQGFDQKTIFRRVGNSPVDGTGLELNIMVVAEAHGVRNVA